jgi:hypothetical protein
LCKTAFRASSPYVVSFSDMLNAPFPLSLFHISSEFDNFILTKVSKDGHEKAAIPTSFGYSGYYEVIDN